MAVDSLCEAERARRAESLILSWRTNVRRRACAVLGQSLLFMVTSASLVAVFFIFVFVIRDAAPFFQLRGFQEFFTSTHWYPSAEKPEFGALAIIVGSALVSFGSVLCAVPLGVAAAVCLSDILPFGARQLVKPVIEMLASIPSVAYGFFALVVLAPLMQEHGGPMFRIAVWVVGIPFGLLAVVLAGELVLGRCSERLRARLRLPVQVLLGGIYLVVLYVVAEWAGSLQVASGTNALNVALVLGVMVLPTIVSVSEDALQSVARELREASYAIGATRAETILRVVLPAASSGICAAVILGLMRAIGETMVVWMASGNAAQIPEPWFNLLEPVRTLTATIAGDMGEADHVTGSARYHVLFAMALCLLASSFVFNLLSEWAVRRERRKLRGG